MCLMEQKILYFLNIITIKEGLGGSPFLSFFYTGRYYLAGPTWMLVLPVTLAWLPPP